MKINQYTQWCIHWKKRAICIPFLLFFFFAAFSLQAQNISISGNQTIKSAFQQIEKQTKMSVDYDESVLNPNKRINVSVNNRPLNEAMEMILKDSGCSYSIRGNHIVIFAIEAKELADNRQSEKNKVIRGEITDEEGTPIIGANVVEKGTTNGVITDMNGQFSLTVSPSSTLQISYIGFIMQEVQVKDKASFQIMLREDTQTLDEVIVVGYGTARKREIVGAMAGIKGQEFSNASTANIKDVLQGKVAGVDVPSSQIPGDDRGIEIRGVRSLSASSSPLVIIDGVPGSLSDVNSYDIESMEVLKDAASSAIYGSRGANGVILVTTKRAKKDIKREVTFNTYLRINVPNMVNMQSGDQYAQMRRDGYRIAHGWDKPYTDEDVFAASELDMIRSGNYTDWQDLVFRNGFIQSYHLGISNSGEKTQLYLSFKYDNEEGYYRTHEVENMNLTVNADHELAKFWKIGTSIRLRRNNTSGYKVYGNDIFYMTPLSQPYKEDGEMNFYPNPINTSGYNPLANYLPGQFIDDKQRNIVNLNLTSRISFTKELTMSTNFGYTYNAYKAGYFYGKESHNSKGVKTSSGKAYQNFDQYTLNNIISYDKQFGEHQLTVDLVGEIQSYKYDSSKLSGENQPVEYTTYHNLASNSDNIQTTSTYEEWSMASGLARVRYNYKNKYFINGAIRADGSSRLAKGRKWAYFPSGGIGWSIKDEGFMENMQWISNLKARASYGTVGNTVIKPFQTQAGLLQGAYLWGETSGDKFYTFHPGSMVNLDLGWEISKTFNTGLDYGFLNNKISGYFEFYNTKTSDVLMERAIPNFNGFSKIWQNIGETQNRGIEMSMNINPVRKKDLTVDFTVNVSRNW